MLNNLSQWANSLLCLGIFTAIIELIMPKGNVKKYIYVIIGIVTVITVIAPILSKDDYESIAKEAVTTISNEVSENLIYTENLINTEEGLKYQEELVKNEYVNNLKRTIWNDLTSKGVILVSVDINIKENYDIENLSIKINKYGIEEYKNQKEIMAYIKEYYDISEKIVKIEEVQS